MGAPVEGTNGAGNRGVKKKKKKGEEKYEDRSSLPQVLKMSEVILHLWRRSKGLSSMRLCVGVPFVRSWLIRKSLRQNLSAPPLHLKDSERKGDPLLRHQGINTKLLPPPPPPSSSLRCMNYPFRTLTSLSLVPALLWFFSAGAHTVHRVTLKAS